MSRIVIYARKSSESDDKQAKSIEEQLAWARDRAAELGDPNPPVYKEARSAHEIGRPEFNRLIEEIWANDDVTLIVTWKADRLARNPVDGGAIQHAIMKGKLEILTADRRYTHADDQFMLNVEFGFSTKYSQDLSKNVKRGLEHKWSHGEWASFAPIGYLNIKGERERRVAGGAIVVDPETAPHVRKLFELCATGNFSLRDLTRLAVDDWHLSFRRAGDKRPVSRFPMTTIEHLLKNPFYYGVLRVKGKILPGSHQPLISRLIFDRVQAVLSGRRVAAERPSKHTFPFTSVILCAACGHRYTAYTVKKKSGRTYTYYSCAMRSKGCSQPHVKEEEILGVLTPLLKQATITPAEKKACIDMLYELNREETDFAVVKLRTLRDQLADLAGLQGRLLDVFLAGDITKDEKDGKAADYAERKTALEVQIRETERSQAGWIELAEHFFEALTDAAFAFESGTADEKRDLLRLLDIELEATPDKLLVKAGTATTLVLNRGGCPIWRTLVDEVRTALVATNNENTREARSPRLRL